MNTLPPCTIGMEACSGAHHWARLFARHGHTVPSSARDTASPLRSLRCRAWPRQPCRRCGASVGLPRDVVSSLLDDELLFMCSRRHSPYEHLALGLPIGREAYTGAVVHDTLGRRVSPSLLRAH